MWTQSWILDPLFLSLTQISSLIWMRIALGTYMMCVFLLHILLIVFGVCCHLTMDPWTATKKALHQCGGDISSCPGPYPMIACPKFHVNCRLGWELSPWIHGLRPKIFIILIVWWWHHLMTVSLPNGRLSWVLCRLGRELFRLAPMLPLMSMDSWAATKKALQYCDGDISSCLGPFPVAACPEFHVCSARPRTFHFAFVLIMR